MPIMRIMPIMKAMQLNIAFIKASEGGRPCLPTGDGYSPDLHVEKNGHIIPICFVASDGPLSYDTIAKQTVTTYNQDEQFWIARSQLVIGDKIILKEGTRLVATGIYAGLTEQGS